MSTTQEEDLGAIEKYFKRMMLKSLRNACRKFARELDRELKLMKKSKGR